MMETELAVETRYETRQKESGSWDGMFIVMISCDQKVALWHMDCERDFTIHTNRRTDPLIGGLKVDRSVWNSQGYERC